MVLPSVISDLEGVLSSAVDRALTQQDLAPHELLESIVEHLNGVIDAQRADVPAKQHQAAAAARPKAEHSDDGWSVARWVESLKLDAIVTEALCAPAGCEAQLAFAQQLDFSRARQLLQRGGIERLLASAISRSAEELRQLGADASVGLNSKFANESSFELSMGTLDVFYGGLDKLVGPPRMLNGSLRLAMQSEHCSERDSLEPFSPSNGHGMQTTSSKEWEFVAAPQMEGTSYPERGDIRKGQPEHARAPWAFAELERRMKAKNDELIASGNAPLIAEEAIGVRLYTGPMFEKYNLALRSQSGVAFLRDRFETLCQGNLYTTVLHSINSCIIKLSRVMKAGRVYRGSTRARLPSAFLTPNELGIKGGVEYGFTSTTVQREQAMHYAKGAASTVFEMEMGMIDRGADVSWLSQYPHEREILFPPLMGLEVKRVRIEGSTLIVEARLSLNLMALTLEQVLARRKKLLFDMAENIALEVRGEMERGGGYAYACIHTRLRMLADAIRQGPLRHEPLLYNKDEVQLKAFTDILKLKQEALIGEMSRFVVRELPMVADDVMPNHLMTDEDRKASDVKNLLIALDQRADATMLSSPVTSEHPELRERADHLLAALRRRVEAEVGSARFLARATRVLYEASCMSSEYDAAWAAVLDHEGMRGIARFRHNIAEAAAKCGHARAVQQRSADPLALIHDAHRASPLFQQALLSASTSVGSTVAHLYKPVTGRLSRLIEQAACGINLCSKVNVVASTLLLDSMDDVAAAVAAIVASPALRLLGCADRFTTPTYTGWRDALLHVVCREDPHAHICTVRITHARLADARHGSILHTYARDIGAMLDLASKRGQLGRESLRPSNTRGGNEEDASQQQQVGTSGTALSATAASAGRASADAVALASLFHAMTRGGSLPGKIIQTVGFIESHESPKKVWGAKDTGATQHVAHKDGVAHYLGDGTRSPKAHTAGWCSDAPVGEWHGVSADAGGRVNHIDLRGLELCGALDASLGSLDQLRSLDLRGNQLCLVDGLEELGLLKDGVYDLYEGERLAALLRHLALPAEEQRTLKLRLHHERAYGAEAALLHPLYHRSVERPRQSAGAKATAAQPVTWEYWFGVDGNRQPYPLRQWQGVETDGEALHVVSLDLRRVHPAPCGVLALPLERLQSLRALSVSSYELTALPDHLGSTLTALDVAYSSITELAPSLSRLATLQSLSLRGCAKLEWLPELSALRSMRRLVLASCIALTALPSLPTSLEELDLDNCWVLTDCDAVVGLAKLHTLRLSESPVRTSIPDLSSCVALRALELHECQHLLSINASLASCTALTALSLMGCSRLVQVPDLSHLSQLHITGLPSQLVEWQRAGWTAYDLYTMGFPSKPEEVDLSGTDIRRLPETDGVALLVLKARRCLELSELPASFAARCKQLLTLELTRSTGLMHVLGLEAATSLQTLNVNGCSNLRRIDSLPQSLEMLRANGCAALEALPSWLHCTRLATVDLEGCAALCALPPLGLALRQISCRDCAALQELPDLPSQLRTLKLAGCTGLVTLPPVTTCSAALKVLVVDRCVLLTSLPSTLEACTVLVKLWARMCPVLAGTIDLARSAVTLATVKTVGSPVTIVVHPAIASHTATTVSSTNEPPTLHRHTVTHETRKAELEVRSPSRYKPTKIIGQGAYGGVFGAYDEAIGGGDVMVALPRSAIRKIKAKLPDTDDDIGSADPHMTVAVPKKAMRKAAGLPDTEGDGPDAEALMLLPRSAVRKIAAAMPKDDDGCDPNEEIMVQWRGGGKAVAIKQIRSAFEDAIDMRRSLRELTILRSLMRGDGQIMPIVQVRDVWSFERDMYLCLELSGTDLHWVIHTSKQEISDEHAQHFIWQIMVGLAYLHASGVIHRDLKPGNILVDRNADVKIADFGLSTTFADGAVGETEAPPKMTEYVVTRWYRAPELLCEVGQYGSGVGTDMWCLACMIAELHDRKALIPGKDHLDQLKKIVTATGLVASDFVFLEQEGAGKNALAYLRALPVTEPLPFASRFPLANPQAIDLLMQMLVFNPHRRLTARTALEHPYLQPLTSQHKLDVTQYLARARPVQADGVGQMIEAMEGLEGESAIAEAIEIVRSEAGRVRQAADST